MYTFYHLFVMVSVASSAAGKG